MGNVENDSTNSQSARKRRRDALGAMAQAAPQGISEARPADDFGGMFSPAGKKRIGAIAITALIAIALIVAGVYGYQRFNARQLAPILSQLRIDLMASKLYCPEFIAWSPDSLSLAVIASAQDCNSDSATAQPDQALAVYSARTGALEKRVGITSSLSAANLTGSAMTVGWSRDGSSVYVICAVQSASGQTGAAALLVSPVGSDHAQLYTSSLGEYPSAGVIWNLHGQVSASALSQPLAPALTYTWSSGAIAPRQPFPLDLTNYTGTANQASKQGGFSFWQPGTVMPIVAPDSSPAAVKPPFALIVESLTNQTAADGSAFVSGLPLYGRLQAPLGTGSAYRPSLCITADTKDACLSPLVPYADKALAAVSIAVEQGVQTGGQTIWYPASVAWRPDGAFLAALLPTDGFDVSGSAARVTIYSTSTGDVVARFVAPRTFTSGGLDNLGVSPAQWSPSGQQIALADFASSVITIWDARALKA